jgi:iron complex transport system substrate-binding protein
MVFHAVARFTGLVGFLLACFAAPVQATEVTDVLGRKVNVPDKVERVVLGEGRLIYAVALLDRDAPFKRIVGWQNDLRLMDPHTYDRYAARYPEVKRIPLIGQASEQSVSAEKILSLKPDVAVFSIAGHGPTEHSGVADLLEKAGVAVLFVDFRVKPIEDTPRSIALLGKALGREREAQAYVSFYESHLKRITTAVAGLPESARPKVFIELLAGVWQAPGHTTGKGGMGDFIVAAGGRNIAANTVPGAIGDVSVEYVLQSDPDIYVASGNRKPGVVLGAGMSATDAQASLRDVLGRPEFKDLRAIRSGNAHGIWHDFYNSPFNLIAIEALAKWTQPALFKSLDPSQTQNEVFNRFLNMGNNGSYFVTGAAAKP